MSGPWKHRARSPSRYRFCEASLSTTAIRSTADGRDLEPCCHTDAREAQRLSARSENGQQTRRRREGRAPGANTYGGRSGGELALLDRCKSSPLQPARQPHAPPESAPKRGRSYAEHRPPPLSAARQPDARPCLAGRPDRRAARHRPLVGRSARHRADRGQQCLGGQSL